MVLEGKYREICSEFGVSPSLNFTRAEELNTVPTNYKNTLTKNSEKMGDSSYVSKTKAFQDKKTPSDISISHKGHRRSVANGKNKNKPTEEEIEEEIDVR